MNVVHVIFNLRTGGAENMLLDIMAQQVRQGADVSLVVINADNEDVLINNVPRGVKLLEIHRPEGSKNPWYILKFNLVLRRLHPDVIHIHTIRAAGMILGKPAPLGLTIHCCDSPLDYLDRYAKVWAISQAVSDDIQSRSQRTPHIVYNGIDCSLISRRTAEGAHTPVRIVQVGRLAADLKGQDLLIDALATLVNNEHLDIRATLVGDGPSREQLQQQAGQLGVADRVEMLGTQPRAWIYDHLADYDILVQPSRHEGFGLTLVEGMAAGLPVIAADTPGLHEVLENGRRGAEFAGGSAQALAQALRECILDYPRRLQQAAADQAWATATYDIAVTARNYLEQYKQQI